MSGLRDEIQEIASLRPGGIYLLRAKQPFRTMDDMALAQKHLDEIGQKVECKFVLLPECFELVKPASEFVIPARGIRKDSIAISYDFAGDLLHIDGVKVSPDLLVNLITDPDPCKMVSCERKGDVVTCRQEMIEGVR